jgi:hypothetical protein
MWTVRSQPVGTDIPEPNHFAVLVPRSWSTGIANFPDNPPESVDMSSAVSTPSADLPSPSADTSLLDHSADLFADQSTTGHNLADHSESDPSSAVKRSINHQLSLQQSKQKVHQLSVRHHPIKLPVVIENTIVDTLQLRRSSISHCRLIQKVRPSPSMTTRSIRHSRLISLLTNRLLVADGNIAADRLLHIHRRKSMILTCQCQPTPRILVIALSLMAPNGDSRC